MPSQVSQRIAHRQLRDAEQLCVGIHPAFHDQLVEYDQQVQVDSALLRGQTFTMVI
jgi:hypothetical protein